MATPRSERLAITPASSRPLSITPGSRVLKTPLSEDAIWKRLQAVGLDEESIKRTDKAALIAYITKLEAEVFFSSQIFFFTSFLYNSQSKFRFRFFFFLISFEKKLILIRSLFWDFYFIYISFRWAWGICGSLALSGLLK